MDRTTGTVRCLQCKKMKARHAFRRMNSTSGKISRKCFDCVLSDYRKRIAFWTRQCNTCHRWRGIQSYHTEHSAICKSCDKRLRSDGISNNRCTFPPQRPDGIPMKYENQWSSRNPSFLHIHCLPQPFDYSNLPLRFTRISIISDMLMKDGRRRMRFAW